jgi:hypothetical protein
MVKLLDAINPESWPIAAKRLEPVRPNGAPSNWLEYCVAEGWFKQITIQDNGHDALCVWYHVSPDGGLIVNAAVNVTHGDLANVFMRGLELLAKRENCKYIQANTRRLGLVLKGKKFGFHVESVVLRKLL